MDFSFPSRIPWLQKSPTMKEIHNKYLRCCKNRHLSVYLRPALSRTLATSGLATNSLLDSFDGLLNVTANTVDIINQAVSTKYPPRTLSTPLFVEHDHLN